MNTPLLWFANRGTGVVLLVLLTVTMLAGVLATRGDAGRLVPRFLTQGLHRSLSLLSMALLGAHVVTAVADTYVDIRWWQVLSPVGATYKPLWLGLGAVAFDLMAMLVVTSLVRHRLPHRLWRVLHLSAYAVWPVALAHGLGIGTDATEPVGRWTAFACAGVVALAVLMRLGSLALARRRHRRSTPAMVPTLVREAR
ncbi:MAG: ferric reductase-like transmembrane domain-containing protein [Oryzihumus sp.]